MASLQDVLESFGIDFITEGHHHCRPGWMQCECPWCSVIGHYRLGINLSSLGVSCWACGKHKLYDFLLESSGKPSRVVLEAVRGLRGTRGAIWDAEAHTPRGKLSLPKGLDDLTPVHRDYLCSRGMDPDEVSSVWGIRGIGRSSDVKLQWRLFIPVVWRREVVSWTTRAISDEVEPRYWSARPDQEIFNHKDCLYGEDLAKQAVVCVEGPVDVWKIGPGAVCTFGTAFTPAQVLRLSKYPTRVVCYDAEDAAQQKARELCDALEVFPGKTLNVVLETGKDAGECDVEELKVLREILL